MTRKSGAWRRGRDTDGFVREARRRGLRSRAALKLEAMDKCDHLFRDARVVVDLGAAPGGWSQVARRALPPAGRVVALDVLEMEELPGVEFMQGDFRNSEVLHGLRSRIGHQTVDLVLSDMAPNLSGTRVRDQARWLELAEGAAEFAVSMLGRDGALLVKLFQGEETVQYLRTLRERFTHVAVRKPAASRKQSRETYALARGVDRAT
ncbi:MAG: RlmE family RNA methyltransferase [Thiotrichales bacterium]|nr:RlmE family RNA methyltransferase [Thiotrichales bacterium]MCY4350742.1 RlmE family RNA methyltransferase [Thiotrichales bacterium]